MGLKGGWERIVRADFLMRRAAGTDVAKLDVRACVRTCVGVCACVCGGARVRVHVCILVNNSDLYVQKQTHMIRI